MSSPAHKQRIDLANRETRLVMAIRECESVMQDLEYAVKEMVWVRTLTLEKYKARLNKQAQIDHEDYVEAQECAREAIGRDRRGGW